MDIQQRKKPDRLVSGYLLRPLRKYEDAVQDLEVRERQDARIMAMAADHNPPPEA